MTTKRRTVLEHLRHVLHAADGGLSDSQLLTQFVATRDETAFAALVRRHGGMVFGVCRRLLRDHHDVEDCFQATFFVLVRKAGAVVKRESVGSWLYGVAYRTALEARAAIARRRAREKQVEDLPHPEVGPMEPQDWRSLLDEELQRLPEKYREVVILCELEGRPRRQVAGLLGLPEGTVSSRLAEARRQLASRLARRGFVVPAIVLSAAIVPASLTASTVTAAASVTAGELAAVAVGAAALTNGVLKAMWITKLKSAVAAITVAAAVGMSGLAYVSGGGSEAAQAPPENAQDKPNLEALRKENELLRLNLQLTLEKVQALESELRKFKSGATASGKTLPFTADWHKPVDPDGDCKFVRDATTLTIEVPGKDHDLAIERNLMNTPRLLRDVEGDFVAQVRVGGTFTPSATSTTNERIPFVGAGLVLMADDKTYIRLERAALRKDGEVKTYANWELREGGEWVLIGEESILPLTERQTYLRLERRGDKILGQVSENGKDWSDLKTLELKLPTKLKVGVSGGGTSTDPFKPHFDQWRLTTRGEEKSKKD